MSAQLLESKRQLRQQMLRCRREVSSAEADRAAGAAAESLITSKPARSARRIAVYAALPGELPSRPLFDAVVRGTGAALLPRTVDQERLEFFSVVRWEQLRPGRYGVLEPPVDAPATLLEAGDLVVVPGLAFDSKGNRLGHGKGYYDRAFASGTGESPMLVGFGYEFQVVDDVPHGEFDRRMDAIVTERVIRDCTGRLR
jgi:5-formyltetrahydrofolate cyclo-ligase